jgi:hypothetical protein
LLSTITARLLRDLHLGPAHGEQELEALKAAARQRISAGGPRYR